MGLYDSIASITISIFYLYLFLLPFIGIVQVIIGFYHYLKRNEKPVGFRTAIKRYWMGVLLYCIYPLYQYITQGPTSDVFGLIYLVLIPTLIAIYFIRITTKHYPEDLENLIF